MRKKLVVKEYGNMAQPTKSKTALKWISHFLYLLLPIELKMLSNLLQQA